MFGWPPEGKQNETEPIIANCHNTFNKIKQRRMSEIGWCIKSKKAPGKGALLDGVLSFKIRQVISRVDRKDRVSSSG